MRTICLRDSVVKHGQGADASEADTFFSAVWGAASIEFRRRSSPCRLFASGLLSRASLRVWPFSGPLQLRSRNLAEELPSPPSGSPAGPTAYSCGVPATQPEGARGQQPIFPSDQYPVKLPMVSLLGARNDLPNPYGPGADFGQLPEGRKWGSTASVTTAPDGTIWVTDRCGNSGAGGTTCGGASANVNPIFQFDPSGKMLKSLGAGMFVSPHKLTVDKDGNLWMADNGAHQVFKLSQDGKVLLTLGKKGVAGSGQG